MARERQASGTVAATTAKFKPNPQSCFLADEMEALQERMLQEFAEIRAAQGKLILVDGISEQLAALNAKLSEHTVRLDQVQMKVNLSCDALGQVQQKQKFQVGQRAKQQSGTESSSPTASDGYEGILGAAPCLGVFPSPRQVQVSVVPPLVQTVVPVTGEEVGGKR
ncbi:hypothetical protein D1007_03834 [Hordeum vulgare]|nr:hypothetical protein D1007_03834 [Hordeum vulgare]